MPRVLQVKWEYAKKLLEGSKKTTIRLGPYRIGPGEVLIHSAGRIIAKAVVSSVKTLRVKDLTDDDAVKDGFSSKEELVSELKKLYGREVGEDQVVTVIELERIEPVEASGDAYGGLAPKELAELALRSLKDTLSPSEIRVLEAVYKTGSIREAARRLFGSWRRRHQVRAVLRRAYELIRSDKGDQ